MSDQRHVPQFGDILRLVPHSGIQFVDCRLNGEMAAGVTGTFIEHATGQTGPGDTTLIPLSRHESPAPAFNPVTGEQLSGERCHVVSGEQAVEAFAGTWIPLPFLRFIGRNDAGPEFDAGPSNWVRCFIGDVLPGTRNRNLVLAFDTHMVEGSRLDHDDYAAPCGDDATFGSIFALAADATQSGRVLGDIWFSRWIETAFRNAAAARPAATAGSVEFEALAHFLTLLQVLAQSADLPQARFADTLGMRQAFPVRGAELIIDIGEATTSAVLVEPGTAARGASPIEHVQCRDLGRPTERHSGPFPTRVEFERPPFGEQSISRMSGRLSAFSWPSVVRIGFEAQRLSLRANGTEGLTGLTDLPAHVRSGEPTKTSWRFSTDDAEDRQLGPLVAADWLLEADVSRAQTTGGPASGTSVRPQFPRNALLAFFVGEIALHALTQLHDPRRTDEQGITRELRELRRVVVTHEVAQPVEERAEILRQVRQGIDQLWSALGWHHGRAGLPPKPEVVSSIGGTLSAQMVVLREEIDLRYGGDLLAYIRTNSGARGRWETARDLKVASIDLAERSTSIALMSYGSGSGLGIDPKLQKIERLAAGGARVLQALVTAHILPAIEQTLVKAGLRRARHFIDETLAGGSALFIADDPHFRVRFMHKVLMPAARALLTLYCEGAPAIWHGNRSTTLAQLVQSSGSRLWPLDQRFVELAVQDGARSFDLGEVRVPLRRRAMGATIEEHLGPTLTQIADILAQHGADLVCLFGPYARLATREDNFQRRLALGPSRLLVPHDAGYRSLDNLSASLGGGTSSHAVSLSAACGDARPAEVMPLPDGSASALRRWLQTAALDQDAAAALPGAAPLRGTNRSGNPGHG